MIVHVGQCDIIPLQKGKPGVVILKIQGFPHPRRHLVNKAEDALVTARAVVAHQTVFKLHAQIFVVILVDFQKPLRAVRLAHKYFHILVLHQITVVEHILYFLVIHGKKDVARFHSHLLRDGTGHNLLHHMLCLIQIRDPLSVLFLSQLYREHPIKSNTANIQRGFSLHNFTVAPTLQEWNTAASRIRASSPP